MKGLILQSLGSVKKMINETPQEFLELNEDDTWRSCFVCGGEITQIRKARFSCLNCNQEFIADEEDMRT